jgi:uncharacterized protein YbcV (DUF1398 family)
MNTSTQDTINEAAESSSAGRLHFGQVVALLAQAGVESYHADYRAGRTTYYLPDGSTHEVPLRPLMTDIAPAFDAPAIQAAIRGAQQGRVMYPEFKKLSQAGGCVGYTVWITGRHVTYFGRRGETHMEKFPD